MKKIVVQIHKHRFELESRGGEQDAFVQAVARDLNNRIENLRREHGLPDSARAVALLALMVAVEERQKKNSAAPQNFGEEHGKMLNTLREEVEKTLARTEPQS